MKNKITVSLIQSCCHGHLLRQHHLKFHLKSKQDIEKRKRSHPALESPNFIETSIFNGEQGHRWTVNKLNLASYKIPGCQLLNKKLIYHAIDLGDCVKNAFKWSDLLVIWVLFYTTIKSFNSDRENLSHCPKSYFDHFDAVGNYYKVAQMLL